MTDNLTERICFRAPVGLYDRMALAGEIFGGSPSQRLRIAGYIHDCQATLAYLRTPRGEAELDEHERLAAIEQVQSDLDGWLAAAFNPERMEAANN